MTKESETSLGPTAALIERLSLAVGVSGYRGPNNIHDAIMAELSPVVDQVDRDRMGSVIGLKQGDQIVSDGQPRHKIMLAAHLDEIGAVVTSVDKEFLRFTQIGGLDDRVLMGQEVIVHGRRDLPGIIGSVPPHLLSGDRSRGQVDQHEMHIDVGLLISDVKQLVQIGDLISFRAPPGKLLNGALTGKAMDNRASIAAMIVCLQELRKLRHRWDVYAVATADEEWGNLLGATTQSYAIRPDAAIVIDVTFADVDDVEIKLNQGPAIALGPGNHPVLRARLLDICQDYELKYQTEVMPSSAGTDAFAIEVSREGIPTVLISVPSRYMHSPAEVVHPKDVERTGRLMAYFIAGLDESFAAVLIPK